VELVREHPTLVGRRFRELHLQLDEFVAAWRETSDTVAERMVAPGGVPDGSAPTVAQRSGLSGLPIRTISDDGVDELFTALISEAVTRVRGNMDANEEPEPVTADLLHGVVTMLEEQLWMIRVQNITR
jgi:starvation-inducible DNA-binding protein